MMSAYSWKIQRYFAVLMLLCILVTMTGCTEAELANMQSGAWKQAAAASSSGNVAKMATAPSSTKPSPTKPTPASASASSACLGATVGWVDAQLISINYLNANPRSASTASIYGSIQFTQAARDAGLSRVVVNIDLRNTSGDLVGPSLDTTVNDNGSGWGWFEFQPEGLTPATFYEVSVQIRSTAEKEVIASGFASFTTLKPIADRLSDVSFYAPHLVSVWSGVSFAPPPQAEDPSVIKSKMSLVAAFLREERDVWYEGTYGDIAGMLSLTQAKDFIRMTRSARLGMNGFVSYMEAEMENDTEEWATFGIADPGPPTTQAFPAVQTRVAKVLEVERGKVAGKVTINQGEVKLRALKGLILATSFSLERAFGVINNQYGTTQFPYYSSQEYDCLRLTDLASAEYEVLLNFYSANQLSRDQELAPLITEDVWSQLLFLKGYTYEYRIAELNWLRSLKVAWQSDRDRLAQYVREQYIPGWSGSGVKGKAEGKKNFVPSPPEKSVSDFQLRLKTFKKKVEAASGVGSND